MSTPEAKTMGEKLYANITSGPRSMAAERGVCCHLFPAPQAPELIKWANSIRGWNRRFSKEMQKEAHGTPLSWECDLMFVW